MAAPSFVPNTLAQQPRRGLDIPPAGGWVSTRPGELGPEQPQGRLLGRPGPDQGFALRLVRHLEKKLVVPAGEGREDVEAGCVSVGMARAAMFGRAPVIHDLDVAFRIWGYLGEAPAELVELRRPLFEGAAHHYETQRAIVDSVPESTLRLTHGEVATGFPGDWKGLLGLS